MLRALDPVSSHEPQKRALLHIDPGMVPPIPSISKYFIVGSTLSWLGAEEALFVATTSEGDPWNVHTCSRAQQWAGCVVTFGP